MENNFENKFNEIEIINNSKLGNKALAYVDSFYINSALITSYNKKGAELINIRDSVGKMYEDIYRGNIKIPENIDDSWTSTTLSRYVENDIKDFGSRRRPTAECIEDDLAESVLICIRESKVFVNYEGLKIELKLNPVKDLMYQCNVVCTLRGKLMNNCTVKGKEIDFQGVIAPACKLQRHEELELQIFLKVGTLDFVIVKIGEKIEKVYVDTGTKSREYSFEELGIKWGSFDINRGV